MARTGVNDRRRRRARRWDGAFRCGLCPDRIPQPDNDWCPVFEGVVCEDCCRSLMMGDERLLAEVSEAAGREITPDDVIARCTECERLIRIVSEHLLDGETEAARLPMH